MAKIELTGNKDTYTLEASKKNKGLLIGYRHSDHLEVSAKKIKYSNEVYQDSYHHFANLEHPHLAKTLDLIDTHNDLYVVREYYQGTSLKTILDKRILYHKFDEPFFIQLCIQLLKAVNELHKAGVLHLDIKPANIIIRHPEKQTPKEWKAENMVLIDFEQSLCYPVLKPIRNRFTLIYSPPEQLLNRLHLLTPASDISAIGIVLYEMIAGSAPFVDCNAEILVNLQLTYPIKKWPAMHDDLFKIIQRATHKATFPKPPRMLDHNTINQILVKGIQGRYTNCNQMITELENYMPQTKKDLQQPGLWQRCKKRLGLQ